MNFLGHNLMFYENNQSLTWKFGWRSSGENIHLCYVLLMLFLLWTFHSHITRCREIWDGEEEHRNGKRKIGRDEERWERGWGEEGSRDGGRIKEEHRKGKVEEWKEKIRKEVSNNRSKDREYGGGKKGKEERMEGWMEGEGREAGRTMQLCQLIRLFSFHRGWFIWSLPTSFYNFTLNVDWVYWVLSPDFGK